MMLLHADLSSHNHILDSTSDTAQMTTVWSLVSQYQLMMLGYKRLKLIKAVVSPKVVSPNASRAVSPIVNMSQHQVENLNKSTLYVKSSLKSLRLPFEPVWF